MGEIIFRRMTLEDVGKVAETDKICFGADGWDEDFFIDELRDKNSEYIVGEIGGKIVACNGIKFHRNAAYNMTIAVLPEFQGRGIGEKILSESIKRAKNHGAKYMTLEVRVDNLPALQLYKKFGFQIIGRIKKYYMGGEDAFTMYANFEDLKCKLLSDK